MSLRDPLPAGGLAILVILVVIAPMALAAWDSTAEPSSPETVIQTVEGAPEGCSLIPSVLFAFGPGYGMISTPQCAARSGDFSRFLDAKAPTAKLCCGVLMIAQVRESWKGMLCPRRS